VQSFLESKYNWDELASNHVWAFGPEYYGSNVLVNDSLVSDTTNQDTLNRVKQSVVQGGPLCDEPMRNVKFRVIDAEIAKSPMDCPPGQIIPTARRAFYSAFLTATPRMMEPVYYTEVQCTTKESI
jgi:116 kDa U5 small nuclear ribonucleoprotein component